jgi:hypothetical protein
MLRQSSRTSATAAGHKPGKRSAAHGPIADISDVVQEVTESGKAAVSCSQSPDGRLSAPNLLNYQLRLRA